MLILPIVNKNRILNVEVKLKTADKIRTGVKFSDALESDVIVNGKKFSESSFKNEATLDKATLDFIRINSMRFRRNYLVTTRAESGTNTYDVYEVEQPPRKVNDALDNLYVSAITDMRKEIPGVKRGRYLSFEKLGIGNYFTDEKVQRLQEIVKTVKDTSLWPEIFQKEGLIDMVDTLEFVQHFDCTVVDDTTIPEDTIQGLVESLKKLNTRETRNLASYYNMALANRDIYAKLSTVNKVIYDKPLTLIQSKRQKQKQLVKARGESSNGIAA